MSIFYPSLVANLRLSFDPTLTIKIPGFSPTAPQSVEDLIKSASSVVTPTTQPLVTAKGPASRILNRVPSSGMVELPGHRPAARFHLSFPYKELPIDPRTINGCAVDIYLGTVTPAGFTAGMAGKTLGGVKLSVLDTSEFFGVGSNLLLTGLVDEWQVDHGEDGSVVSMGGRDLRGILIDTPISTDPTRAEQILDKLNLEQPIQFVVQDLLANHPMMAGIKIRVSPDEWPTGIPMPGADALGRNRKGAKGRKTGGRPSAPGGSAQLSFWGLTVRLCSQVYAIPAFVGTELRIRPARSLYDQQRAGFDPAVPTPFEGGALRDFDSESGKSISPISVRKMLYGRDVLSMTFARKFAGYHKPRQVVCISVDQSAAARGTARQISGFYPTEAIAGRAFADGVTSMADTLWVPVADIRDKDRLSQMAQAIYEEAARGEISGSCTTRKLSSFGGDNTDPDLLKLRPGDAVEFATDVRSLTKASPLVSAHTDHMRAPFEQAVKELTERLGDENVARVILAASRGQINEVQGFFRVVGVQYKWGEEGLEVSFDFQNFIEKTFDESKARSKTGGATFDLTVPRRAK